MRLIDADATIKEIKARNPDDVSYEDAWAITCIEHAPTIKPERRTGRWIIEPGIGCKCSECDFDIGNDLDFMEYVNFCPNCGADMRGEQDE